MVLVVVFPHNLFLSSLVAKVGFVQDEVANLVRCVDSSWVEVVASGNNMLGFDMQGLDTYFEVEVAMAF